MNKKLNYTPKPWSACHNGECSCKQVSAENHPICEVISGEWGDTYPALRIVGTIFEQKVEAYIDKIPYGTVSEETAIANARLIAAAPDMYEALLEIISECPEPILPYGVKVVEIAKAALAKANGESDD